MECWSCKSNTGEKRISPGPTIHAGQYWLVEHAYPVRVVGWLVIVLKRHAEALHELTANEFAELAQILGILTRVLIEETGCEKEYLSCYAEAEHYCHVHFHLFAKPHDLPKWLRGAKSFKLLKVADAEAAPLRDVIAFCERFRSRLAMS